MKKYVYYSDQRRDICAGFMLCACTVFITWFFCVRHGMFGSKVDWISQHSVLPDYFRRQFYETGELLPEFAANIGGGQNIYNFSYYGLLSPAVLLSYLLPFVKMSDYLMAVEFLSLTASVLIFYRWLSGCSIPAEDSKERRFDRKVCFLVSVIFLMSGPMVYQSYNQIMFVNYMPFLCMGFLGTDRYFRDGKRGLLTVSVFLMIMTSFYFSIGGMGALCLYGLHRYVRDCRHKNHVKETTAFLLPFFTAVMMSGVLLIPTAAALAGRGGSEGAKLSELFVPEFSAGRLFYSPYGIGLTTLSFTSLMAMCFFRRWQERILAWGCTAVLTVPFFAYVLNGGLYVRGKVLIPFLPLLCYVTAYYVNWLMAGQGRAEKSEKTLSCPAKMRRAVREAQPFLVTAAFLWIYCVRRGMGECEKVLLADSVLMLSGFVLFRAWKNVYVLLILPVLILALSGNRCHMQAENYLDWKFYEKVTDERAEELIKKTVKSEKGFYRTEQFGTLDENAADINRIWDTGQYVSSIYSSLYNQDYRQFRKQFGAEEPYRNFLMQPSLENPVFRRFMGVKYVVSDGKVHENRAASPVVYATDRVMDKKAYEKLDFPENQLKLLSYAVVGDGTGEREDEETMQAEQKADRRDNLCRGAECMPVSVSLPCEIDSCRSRTVSIDVPAEGIKESSGRERVLFLRFCVKNRRPSKDVAIWLEDERNKLTSRKHIYYNENEHFTYALPIEEGKTKAKLVFEEGCYQISDVQCFLGTLPSEKEAENLYQSAFFPDKEKTKGNVISGRTDVRTDGYLVTTFPYDKGFKIFVDGNEVNTERVNTAFLGCRIKKGEHKVEIRYHAPGMRAGKLASLAGIMLLLCVNFRWRSDGSGKGRKNTLNPKSNPMSF